MAGALVGGAVLSAFLQVAFDRLASPAVLDYFRDKKLDDKLLKKMKVILLSINASVDDAEDKHYTNQHVSEWLDMVKDAVLDAEDLLDEIDTEASKSKLEAEFKTANTSSKVWRSYLPVSVSSFEKQLHSRMEEILDNLETLAREKDVLRLERGTGVGVGVGLGENVSERQTTSLVDEAAIYGRDNDTNVITDLLLSDSEKNLSVISIVGMGGMSKTTVAQLVYNDSRMKDEFQFKVWVCIGGKLDTVRVTRKILDALTLPSNDIEDLNSLQVKLKEKLTGNKFLLVLDDVWDENYLNWERLKAPFVCGAQGSKILVTSRSKKVASAMRCAHVHQLEKLLEEHSWLLFSKYALCDSNSTSDLEEIGRKIIKKCNGLPLALKAIGSLLYTKLSYEDWNEILISEVWDISDDGCDIISALRLSYQYLPSPLKRCFAYCSLIPKDYEFDKDCLVELWMAENFLQVHRKNMSMKELGDQVFNDLLLRSFFQQSSRERKLFVMHDLVNDLATHVSREFCLRLEKEEARNASEITRHISYFGNFCEGPNKFESIYKANKLRTFLPFSYGSMSSDMLDYLLCKGTKVRRLPNGLGKLKKLEVLSSFYVGKCGESNIIQLAELKLQGILSIKELQNVSDPIDALAANLKNKIHLEGLTLGWSMNDSGSENQRNVLENLQPPVNLKELTILHYGGTRFPNWFGHDYLSNIVSLNLINCKFCFSLPPLGILPSLKSLYIIKLEGIETIGPEFYGNNSFVAPFGSLQYLLFQRMNAWEEWDCRNELGAFPCLKELHMIECPQLKTQLPGHLPSLLTLIIRNCMQLVTSLPCAQAIHELHLSDCGNLHLESLASTLKILWIGGQCIERSLLEETMHTMSNTCLETLDFWDCPNVEFRICRPLNFLRSFNLRKSCKTLKAFSLDLFPKLQRLFLEDCSNLERLSFSDRLDRRVTSLTELIIEKCPKLVSFPEGMHTLFPSLRLIHISHCPQLELPEGGFPSSLGTFRILNCPKLIASQMRWNLHSCTSLSQLHIKDENCNKVDYKGLLPPILKKLDDSGPQLFSSLNYGYCPVLRSGRSYF
ncbi:putative winged helix-turn-helix DNA-binding domain, leucine-rich repeat domain, L [Lupinus albus]|uniref:Putative winged helix-turn-helix DNA-binding domain, leucine-rich repeat domain, L n=1 Tax=Lupinus albus TaxID=3870 RepID=A0A6A4Q1N1_LUPAL|nr:putative winged helix-turn-helix DNA-binding domain, leucine-rich repeat domain, L [Lupinus albus]